MTMLNHNKLDRFRLPDRGMLSFLRRLIWHQSSQSGKVNIWPVEAGDD